MNAKYALALILALQVSMSLCDSPTPSAELANKYNELKGVFFKRLLNAYSKLQAAAAPYAEKYAESEQALTIRTQVEDLQTKPEFQAAVKIGSAIGAETAAVIDKIRAAVLSWYERNLREQHGTALNNGINQIKVILDQYLPADQ